MSTELNKSSSQVSVRLIICLLAFLQISGFSLVSAVSPDWRIVERVIDGDTIVLDGKETVRLIGIDTPGLTDSQEIVASMAREARGFLSGLAEGKKVRLEYDQNKTDMYSRTLAYVFLEDGTFVNEKIVREGYSAVYTAYPFRHMESFRKSEKEARQTGKGLWAESYADKVAQPAKSTPQARAPAKETADVTVYVTKTGSKYHRAGCRYLRTSSIPMSLKQAAARYGPCSVCRPPVP
jgi:micrococcal nuclease